MSVLRRAFQAKAGARTGPAVGYYCGDDFCERKASKSGTSTWCHFACWHVVFFVCFVGFCGFLWVFGFCGFLFVVCCLLFVLLLFVVCRLLLFVVCCLLFVVCCCLLLL